MAGRSIDNKHVKGVFVTDLVPWTKMSPGSEWSVILNTDSSSLPGEHWVAVANKPDGRGCWFFDSYGLKPTRYRPVLWGPLNKCNVNTEDYQQDHRTVCGDYALFFLWLFHAKPPVRCRGRICDATLTPTMTQKTMQVYTRWCTVGFPNY